MKRMYALVEGQTEETFVRDVLAPHLAQRSVYLNPVIIKTGRGGGSGRGGISHYHPIQRNLRELLGDSGASAVTTMFDFYDLPADFPGRENLPTGKAVDRAEHLEQALAEAIGDRRLLPYLSLHEFEALLFVQPDQIRAVIPNSGEAVATLVQEAATFSNPEEIDEGPETHPSARLGRRLPGYRKRLHGPLVVQRIGLPALRSKCPHFDHWITLLENFQ